LLRVAAQFEKLAEYVEAKKSPPEEKKPATIEAWYEQSGQPTDRPQR
jgi:hypothetical protein